VQLEDAPQIVSDMASPAGLEENSAMVSQAQPDRVRPTHTPAPRKPKMETSRTIMTRDSFIMHSAQGAHDLPGIWPGTDYRKDLIPIRNQVCMETGSSSVRE